MADIYCVKCREYTNTRSNSLHYTTTSNGRNRVTGICTKCGSNKGTFTNNNWGINHKTPKELESAKKKRVEHRFKKKALTIGLEVLAGGEDVQKCVKACLPKKERKKITRGSD